MLVLPRTNHDPPPPTVAAHPDVSRLRRAWARDGPPSRATFLAGWALVPLRLFLGGTFVFAGLQKLANPAFFDASDPASIQAQMRAAARLSPLHALVAHLVHAAVPLGVLIALGELAIGAATLVGLWSRVAAGAGMVLSFSLFLTVSFHSSPWYTGADIVFLFAWTPLLVAGAGGVLSADAAFTDKARARRGLSRATVVPVPFAVVQQVCGFHDNGACRAMAGAPCLPVPCPYLRRGPGVTPAPVQGDIDRRTFALQGAGAAALAGVALAGAGAAAGVGRLVGRKSRRSLNPVLDPGTTTTTGPVASTGTTGTGPGTSPTSSPTSAPTTTPAGTRIGAASGVPVGSAATFQDPRSGDPAIVVQPQAGTFVAFDAVCPHQGCIVAYSDAERKFVCPCHGSRFNVRTGAVENGPAPTGLGRIKVAEGSDGQLYAT